MIGGRFLVPFVMSYKAKTMMSRDTSRHCDMTIRIYNQIIAYLLKIIQNEWDVIKDYGTHPNEKKTFVEKLIHKTRQNHDPKYADFDEQFPNLPTYLRRDAIQTALGDYKSWVSNHQNWLDNGRQGKEPHLTLERKHAPSFYKTNMFKYEQEGSFAIIRLKLYDGKTWDWHDMRLRKTDAKYLQRKASIPGVRVMSPTIKRKGRKWVVSFPFQFRYDLTNASLPDQRVCAVDLGVNTDATCCVMEPDGTVVARKFINHAADKAVLYHEHNKIRKAQSKGARKLKRKWARVNRINEELTRKTVKAIIDFAIEYSCTHIVCEYLDIKGKIKGSRKYRLRLWRKRAVYHHLVSQAHVWGMRVSQVCAWGTSQYAYDGTGRVQRGRYIVNDDGESLGYSYSWVRFSTGKLYHADLNAVYNIGARYYIREIIKTLEATLGSVDLANVLGLPGRSSQTLSNLINLYPVLRERKFSEPPTAVCVV